MSTLTQKAYKSVNTFIAIDVTFHLNHGQR